MKTCPVCDTPYPDAHNTCPTDGAVLIETLEFAAGEIIRGKYKIIRKLGQGGMGSVYLSEHLLLGGELALKFLNVELSKNPQFVKRFRNEARAAYKVRHPNIVEVVDLDQDEHGKLFIAMEYISGPTLRVALRETKGLISVGRVLQVARGVAAGLGSAHARGVVHRDIKPENILLRIEANGEIQSKIADFGIVAMTEGTSQLTTNGFLLTPEYAAPEQWLGEPASELDGRTDLYALGGMIYEMLAGRKAFQASSPAGWMYQHLQCTPDPLSELRPDIETYYPGLNNVVMQLLAKDRNSRFESALAFIEALAATPPGTDLYSGGALGSAKLPLAIVHSGDAEPNSDGALAHSPTQSPDSAEEATRDAAIGEPPSLPVQTEHAPDRHSDLGSYHQADRDADQIPEAQASNPRAPSSGPDSQTGGSANSIRVPMEVFSAWVESHRFFFWVIVVGTALILGAFAFWAGFFAHNVGGGRLSRNQPERDEDGTPWNSEWHERTSGTNDLTAITGVLGGGWIWVVGSHGTIMRSFDRGETWQTLSSGTHALLTSVSFASDSDWRSVWAAGDGGVILESDNFGGDIWKRRRTGTNENLNSLFVRPDGKQVLVCCPGNT